MQEVRAIQIAFCQDSLAGMPFGLGPGTLVSGERMELRLFVRNIGTEPFPSGSSVILQARLKWRTDQNVLLSFPVNSNEPIAPGKERGFGPVTTDCMCTDFALVSFRIAIKNPGYKQSLVVDQNADLVDMQLSGIEPAMLTDGRRVDLQVMESTRAVHSLYARSWNEIYTSRVFVLSAITAAAAVASLILSALLIISRT